MEKIDSKNLIKLRIIGGSLLFSLVFASIPSMIKEQPKGKKLSISNIKTNNENYLEQKFYHEDYDELIKEAKRLTILNTFEYCDTLDKIEKRKQELESLNLTESDKLYQDCPLSAELQHFIYEQSIKNNVPFDFLISLVHVESRGQFNSSGKIGHNPGSEDLGLTQQNSVNSLPIFADKYQVDYDMAYKLLKDDDYANVCSAFLVYQNIDLRFNEFDPYEYAGCYNGWLGWRKKPISRDYVRMFQEVYDGVYNKYHEVDNQNSKQDLTQKIKK